MESAAVLTEGLRRRFGDEDAVAGVDLAVPRGEIYGFLGPNGAGKTTCVRMLCTLLAPTAGRAVVAGFDVMNEPGRVRLHIGAALQSAALDDRQTGREILRLQGRLYGLHRNEIDRRLQELTGLVDIGEALDRRVGTYSGGMKRRLDLAAALVHNPEVLFLDEPTTGLDPLSRLTVWEEVRRLNTDLGMTIFLTTQYLEEADELCGRVGIIDRGHIVAEGAPADLKRAIGADVVEIEVDEASAATARTAAAGLEGVTETTMDGAFVCVKVAHGAAAITPLALALDAAGVTVRSLTMRTPTLDDVFLQLTGGHIEEAKH